MKKAYIEEIKRAFKSSEYWFAFILIIVSSAWTAIYNLDKYGVLYHNKIGTAEFFYACIMLGNTLLQISIPIIPIFVSMFASGIYDNAHGHSDEEKQTISTRTLATLTISTSVFFLSFLLIAIVGIVFFPSSTGDITQIGGPFDELYHKYPFSIIPITILYSCIFASVYSLLGMGIGMNLNKNKILAFFIPLAYYFCFNYIVELVPSSLQKILFWILPLDTFNLVGTNVPLYKKITEMLFVFIVAIVLVLIANRKNKMIDKGGITTTKEQS